MKKLVLSLVALLGMLFVTAAAEARPHRADQSGVSRQSAQYRVQRVKKVRKAYRNRYGSRVSRSYRTARSYRSYRAARVRSSDDVASSSNFGSLTGGGGGGLGPRPGKWCGWWMRTQLGGGPALNLAWNWSRYGSATSPQVGAIVVWRHHVGIITGQASNGQWIVKSGNDGGAVRERARPVSGAVFRI